MISERKFWAAIALILVATVATTYTISRYLHPVDAGWKVGTLILVAVGTFSISLSVALGYSFFDYQRSKPTKPKRHGTH